MAILTLTFLGSFQAAIDNLPITRFRSDKVRALLAYLAVEADRPHSRASLCGLLWPDQSDDAALHNLSQTLLRLREALGDTRSAAAFLRISRQAIQWNAASDHYLDATDFARLACSMDANDLDQAAGLYHGEFLPGFSLSGCAAFEEWLLLTRERFAHLALAALDTLTRTRLASSRYPEAAQHARRQLALDPWREDAHRQLMRALAGAGDRAAALAAYARCRQVLHDELGVEPDEATRALYEQIRNNELDIENEDLRAVATLHAQSSIAQQAPDSQLSISQHNLPAQLTSFIGRDQEIEDIRRALSSARLLTLTGAAGCGKTRLALRVAAEVAGRYADGVRLVELAPLTDPTLVPQAVAAGLGLREASSQPLSQLLVHELRSKRLLLVLDDCEHLVDACRQLADQLLRACPQLTIMATSREVLHIAGERVWHVLPLSTPGTEAATPALLMRYEGIRLFVERAGAANPEFALTERNAPAVAQICRRLDGIPLALELAAARARHMPVEAIAARLDDCFSLLAAGSRTALPRQQTLRATLDWSYELLTEPERVVFRQLAVFAGGFTLPAAEAVAGVPDVPATAGANTVDLLSQLLDKSLLIAERRNETTRYRLLETMRAYALERLIAADAADAARDRHLACFIRLAEEAEPHLFSADQVAWLDQLAIEHDNLRAAIDWSLERANAHATLRMVTALRSFWYTRGHYDEGLQRILRALAMPSAQAHTRARASALNAAGAILWARGDAAEAHQLLDEALAIGREVGDQLNTGWALLHMGTIAYQQDDDEAAQPLLEAGLASCRAAGAAGRRGVGWGLIFLADLALHAGEQQQARARFEESVALLHELADYGLLAYPLRRLGHLALQQGDFATATAHCTESLRLNRAIDDRLAVAACLAALAGIAAAEGQAAGAEQGAAYLWHAARLCGAVAAQLEPIGAPLWPADAAAFERSAAAVGAQLGEAGFDAARAEGRAMTLEQLIERNVDRLQPGAEERLAAQDHPSRSPSASPPAPIHNLPAALTPLVGRETELSELTVMLRAPETRLLTIVGAGGMGKTRLALELARTTFELFADGVSFVALAPLASADALASAMVHALDLTVQDGDLTAGLVRSLRDKQMLLVLDNFEHLLDTGLSQDEGGAGLVVELLQSAPGLRIVATSRERLNVRSEQRYVVQGMAYQPDAMDADPAELPAVRLFVQSAQRVQPQFSLSEEDLPTVLEICRLTLGMPLGLELAAAWVEMLPLAEIAAQIAHSADFLAADLRDLPERQRSMHAVFDWSWRLLRAGEQRSLRQLTVFRGEFTIAAAQTVAEASLPSLLRLVEKSLLRINDGRYEMHDLLRQFAAEQLDADERAAVRRCHACYYLTLAEETATALAGPEQAAALARLSREHDNLRAALGWCLETESVVSGSLLVAEHVGQSTTRLGLRYPDQGIGQANSREPRTTNHGQRIELGLRLAGALWPFWERYCHLTEGRRWLESFLEHKSAGTVAPEVRAIALIGAGCLAQDQDDYARADALFAEGLRLERMLGRTDRVTRVLANRGITVRAQGQYAQATALLEECLAVARAAGDRADIAYVLRRLGGVMRERGDYARAANLYQECLDICRALGDRSGEGSVLLGLSDIARDQGDAATTEAYSDESLTIGRELGQHWIIGFALNNLAQAAIMQGDYAQALPLAEEALALFRAQDIQGGVVELLITQGQIACAQAEYERARATLLEGVAQGWPAGPHELVAAGIEELARVAVAWGNAAQAVRLCAAAWAWREAMDAPQQPYRRAVYEATLDAARQALGDDVFAAAWAEGAAWRPEQAIAAAGAEGHDTALEQPIERGEDQPRPDVGERPAEPDHQSRSPSASPPAPTHNLPSPLSSFVGREDELAHLTGLWDGDIRLITVVGAGGAGKTRLALAAAWALRAQFADGVWWVALAGVQPADDPALQRATLASSVASALGQMLGSRRAPLDELADVLHNRALLLVLDNCEHLPEVAAIARALLEAAPSLCVLATSREPLGLAAEMLVRLDGLRVPEHGAADPASYPGVRLFLQRAAQHTPGWGQVPATMAATARLCRLLEGLPLGIELAAHWVGHYTPDEIAEAIQADLDFLAVRTRDIPDRHRSLRAVFDYAWHLLSAAERRALARLSVFRGSFDRAAAQAVAAVRATTLVALVDKSLLRQAGLGHYSLHELLRQFAAERLLASGDVAAMRAQHAAYYLALAEQAGPELAGPLQATWLERLERAFDNLRAALSWAQERGQMELGLRLAGVLERFWFTRGYLNEGREWLEHLLIRASALEVPPAVRAQAFSAVGLLANTQGDHSQATQWLEQGLVCYREADDLVGAVRALTTLGGVAYDQGDLRGALERWEESLAQARAMGDLGEVARALGNMGEAEYHLGDLASAAARHTEALALARQLGRTNLEAFQLGDLGNVARRQGDLVRATALHRQALELKHALGARRQIAITLEDLAGVAGAEGRGERAASLLGAASAVRQTIGTPQIVPERLATEQAVAAARGALGEEAWAAAFAAGRALSLEQAIIYALQ